LVRGSGLVNHFEALSIDTMFAPKCSISRSLHMSLVVRRTFAGFGKPQPTRIFPGVKRLTELVVEKGKGCEVWTTEGARYLDFTAGIGVVSTGHCHPRVVAAVQEQAGKMVHAQQSCYYSITVNQLIEKLSPLVPQDLDSFFFANSGAEAVEGALRLARQATGRDTVIAFLGGYHGRTSGSLAITSSSNSYRGARSGPLPGGTAWAQYPYEFAGFTAEHSLESLDLLLLQQATASEVAAVIIEPVLGEGGYVVPPEGYLKTLRDWCTARGILLIADEVQSGCGRTGRMWAYEHFDVVPDILVTAKGIASGYPLSVVTTRSELSALQSPGCMGGTYGGNAVACAAALATLDVFEQEGLLENARLRGDQLMQGLRSMGVGISSKLGDVRGLGLMVGAEFNREVVGKKFAGKVSQQCFERGLLVLTAGHRETLRLCPPLVVTESEVDETLGILHASISAAFSDIHA